MKKKFRITILSLVSIVLLMGGGIGVSFSVWCYYNIYSKEESKITVTVEEIVMDTSAGGWTSKDIPTYAIVDGAMGNSFYDSITGLSFYKTDTGTTDGEILMDKWLTVVFTCNESVKADDLLFGIQVNISGVLADYFEISAFFKTKADQSKIKDDAMPNGYADFDLLSDDFFTKIEKNISEITVHDINDIEVTKEIVTYRINMGALSSFFVYREGMYPDSQAQYDAMKKDLANSVSEITIVLYQGRKTAADDSQFFITDAVNCLSTGIEKCRFSPSLISIKTMAAYELYNEAKKDLQKTSAFLTQRFGGECNE